MGTSADLLWAHPVVREWFTSRFGTPTEPQTAGWPHILAHRDTLISAPTGSGKTLAAFLACIDSLVRQSLSGTLGERTQVLYVSPLKALGNDVQKNLDQPLFEIQQLAAERGYLMPAIRTMVRTGDTPTRERARMLKVPPHILVTTPESLYILLTAARSRELLRDIRTVIVDEIHALANNKRGAHLAISLERLDVIAHQRPNRIGLSATQRPLSLVAEFLSGNTVSAAGSDSVWGVGVEFECHPERSEGPRGCFSERRDQSSEVLDFPCLPERSQGPLQNSNISTTSTHIDLPHHTPVVVQIPSTRPLDLAIELPSTELGPIASNELWDEIYDRLEQLALAHRSTLVFVNTRRLVERISHRLSERMGEEHVAAHHGSLSRHIRLQAECRLKQGQCRILIATASLELGIDIGNVDLVCQIGSPRAIAIALQRVGRAGHWRGAIPKGRFFATTRDELVECAAIIRAIRQGDLDRLILPDCPLDILAQQIVACCAADEWDEDALFSLMCRARNYRDLPRSTFDKILAMLSEGISAKRGRYGAYLYRDQVNHRLRARRGARLAAITSGGAIPETALYNVVSLPEETVIGSLDEDFAIETHAGDIMLLGNTSWRIHRVESNRGRVLVEDAHGLPPTIPFWRGEAPGRTIELSHHVGQLRELISFDCHPERSEGPQQAIASEPLPTGFSGHQPSDSSIHIDLSRDLDLESVRQLSAYIREGCTVLGAVPSQRTIIAERFFDEGGGMQLVIHAPFGARINKAWGLALRKRFCRSFNFELQASATDDGINIALAEQHSFPLADVFHFLQPETVEEVLQQAVLTGSPIFATRFRWDANRSLALLRFQGGKKVPPQIQRMRSDDLLAAVFPDVAACFENIEGDIQVPDHPLVEEVMKDVMHEAMDIDGLRRVLEGIRDGSIRTVAIDTPVPSQFAHEILNANPYAFLDDAPLEERRARAVQLRRAIPASVLEEAGKLDPAAIVQVIEESRPDPRDPDDLHDLLQTLILFPAPISTHVDGTPSVAFDLSSGFTFDCHPERSEGPRGSGGPSTTPGGPFKPSVGLSGAVDLSELHPSQLTKWMNELVETRRAVHARVGERDFWVASEKVSQFTSIYVDVAVSPEPPQLSLETPSPETILDRTLLGWMQHTGPLTSHELFTRFSVAIHGNPTLPRPTIDPEVNFAASPIALEANPLGPSLAAIDASLLRLESTGAILRGHFRSTSGALEWCDRRLLARIHRLTVATLRKQVEPVTAAQFMRWLLRWQHLTPDTALRGEPGVLEALRQLQGFEIPASAWERHVLSRRVRDYDGAFLDHLCLMGTAGWGRLSPHPATEAPPAGGPPVGPYPPASRVRRVVPTSVAPITFFLREDCAWMQPRPHDEAAEPVLSGSAQRVLDALRRRGALFFADLQRLTSLDRADIERGLWELVAAGFVTADGFENLRGLISRAHPASISSRSRRSRHTAGRWSLLSDTSHDASKDDNEDAIPSSKYAAQTPERIEATCWMLLRRYGVVFRELLTRESNLPKWRELQLAFRRLEDRGEIRGGRFVSGFVGEQFALAIAVDSLRESRKLPVSNELITISATDPMNLVGIIVPGERIAAIGPRTVTFRDGVHVADSSADIAILQENGFDLPGHEAAV